jgi:hypothetical protein
MPRPGAAVNHLAWRVASANAAKDSTDTRPAAGAGARSVHPKPR